VIPVDLGLASSILLLFWIGRAVGAVGNPGPELPPVCEECGYNLTHQPADRRCPECGFPIDMSLSPGALRRGSAWERSAGVFTWVQSSFDVVISPRALYRSIRLRENRKWPHAFACWHYALIGCAQAAFMLLTMGLFGGFAGPGVYEMALVLAYVGMSTGLFAWAVHRTGTAIVATWWLVRGSLPDLGWADQVATYESAYLWMPFACSLALLSTVTYSFSRSIPLPVKLLVPFLLLVLLGLALAWLWRYSVAARAVRWSNF
jgi:hypothetical protein